MATFLFWNINRKPLGESVFRLARLYRVDVLMLAECPMSAGEVLAWLNREGEKWEFAAPINPSRDSRIQIYTRLGTQHIQERVAFPHATIRELSWPSWPTVLLAVVHLPSKLWNDASDQIAICTALARQFRDEEFFAGHNRLLAVGDFNVNPFADAMLSPEALNAEASRRIAERGARTIAGDSHRYFFNPMWRFFGDGVEHPAGTYFYSGSKRVRVSWNIFDQVLVRPDLLPYFKTEEVEILTGDGTHSFLNRDGTPDKRQFSDHLPLLFRLNL